MTKKEFIFKAKERLCCNSGFAGGNDRIKDIMISDLPKKEKIQKLKKEYGWGGFLRGTKKYKCLCGGMRTPKGIEIQYYDEKGIKQKIEMNYNEIYNFLNQYYNGGK